MTSAFTYAEIGRTEPDLMPPGYHHVRRHAIVGNGPESFSRLVAGMRDWQIHRLAGIRVTALGHAQPGCDFTSGIGFGPLRISAPCRMVWFADEPNRFGYGFGTVTGHPERGEEAFEARLHDDGVVHFDIRAFSRPASWYARLGGPITTAIQSFATDRYLASARTLAT